MGETGLDKQIEAIVEQLVERFNLAISIAVDDNKKFEQGEEIFQESIAVLEYYSCNDIAADQLVNFSKVAFFRKVYDKALYYAGEAVAKSESQDKEETAADNLHAMAFKIFEIILVSSEEKPGGVGFEEVQEFLTPEDYCKAIQNVYGVSRKSMAQEEKLFLAEVLKKLSFEVMRQGLRQEKCGDKKDALLLFRTVLPFLNPKRASVISAEIRKLEEAVNE